MIIRLSVTMRFVKENAIVMDNATVAEDAIVCKNAVIGDDAYYTSRFTKL